MDDGRFDDLARALGATGSRRAGLRAALGAALGLGLAGAALEADAKRGAGRDAGASKRRHECGPDAPCPANFTCAKQGRKRRCVCATVTCGAACCGAGEICQGGACVTPGPDSCVEFGQPCKNVGVPCCDGLVCGSGQGGEDDVACYVPAGGGCATTGDCTFGSQCLMGLCVANPQPQPTPDDPVVQCVPTIPVTGNAAANGAALKEALDEAEDQSVIWLGSAEYFFAGELDSEDEWLDAYTWELPYAVRIEVCPGATAELTTDIEEDAAFFKILGGSMTFVGPNLTVRSSLDSASGEGFRVNAGTLVLQDVEVEGFDTALAAINASMVQVNGGTLSAPERAIYLYQNAPYDLACDPRPTISGDCQCDMDPPDCPTGGVCCQAWT